MVNIPPNFIDINQIDIIFSKKFELKYLTILEYIIIGNLVSYTIFIFKFKNFKHLLEVYYIYPTEIKKNLKNH